MTTSLAIAEATDNDHASVIKLIRRYLSEFESFGLVRFQIRPRLQGQHGGGDTEFAELNEDHSTFLITLLRNNDIVLRCKLRLVREFSALKQQAQDPMRALSDPATMRGLLLSYTEKVLSLENKIHEQAPKVAALDRIATHSEGSLCVTDAAKVLQLQPKVLFRWLAANDWIYRRVGGSGWIAHQHRLKSGVLEHKITTVSRSDGSEKVVEQVLVTAKGLAKLSEVRDFSRAA